ncbi:kinase-like protein [Hypoxylon sp. NC1633]|nr:kinase-like protein [Hypoxylon sp. NC1633]
MAGSTHSSSSDDVGYVYSKQAGACVVSVGSGVICKSGTRVTRNEEEAMRIVARCTDIPIPPLHWATYRIINGVESGSIYMDFVEGCRLDKIWDQFDDARKESVCHDIWAIVEKLRQIPRPPEFDSLYQCGADGSPSNDVLLKDMNDPPGPLLDDESLRARINQRYLAHNGGSYREHLLDFLPHSDSSVFTHGDLTPRNILVDETGHISAVIDWETAGWYPDYWEFANIQKPARDRDWIGWMGRTKPVLWDITGINKARRVLF